MELFKFPQNKEDIEKVVSRAEYAALMIPSPRQSYVEQVCAQAKEFGFSGVLATPYDCPEVLKQLEGSGVETVCMNALNHALDENPACRVYGIDTLLEMGVKYFELSVPCGVMKDDKFDIVEKELFNMAEKIHGVSGKVSIILEPECMKKEFLKKLISIAEKTGVDYIRICSGFENVCGTSGGRATMNLICFVREECGGRIPIKAGGGWDYAYLEDCAEYIDSGASCVDVGPRFVEQLTKLGYRRDM